MHGLALCLTQLIVFSAKLDDSFNVYAEIRNEQGFPIHFSVVWTHSENVLKMEVNKDSRGTISVKAADSQ